MGESIADSVQKTADVMHWLGKYEISNVLTFLARFLRASGITDIDQLEELVNDAESV